MLTQHRTGVFFGAGIEIDLHWAIPQTVTEVDLKQGVSQISTATLKGLVSGDISPLISVGYHLTLRKNLALRFEASALFSVLRSPAASYKIYLKGATPLSFTPYIDYKKPIKLRFSTGVTVYLS